MVSQEIYSRSQQIKSGNQTRQGLQSQLNHKDYLQHLHPFSQSVSQDSSVSMPWLTAPRKVATVMQTLQSQAEGKMDF